MMNETVCNHDMHMYKVAYLGIGVIHMYVLKFRLGLCIHDKVSRRIRNKNILLSELD